MFVQKVALIADLFSLSLVLSLVFSLLFSLPCSLSFSFFHSLSLSLWQASMKERDETALTAQQGLQQQRETSAKEHANALQLRDAEARNLMKYVLIFVLPVHRHESSYFVLLPLRISFASFRLKDTEAKNLLELKDTEARNTLALKNAEAAQSKMELEARGQAERLKLKTQSEADAQRVQV